MGHYKIVKVKDEKGVTIERWIEPISSTAVVSKAKKPASATLAGGTKTVIQCKACEVEFQAPKEFKTKAIMANHFKKSHDNLYMDKDSWRKYAREITVEE